ncbi:MAG: hypothetical protein HYY18_12455 [Planctomycetes bacterium]|nr:hypothetical protein [Planctomycetota bacterium]
MKIREAEARLEMIRALMDRGARWPGLATGALHILLGTLLLLQPRESHDAVHFDPVEDR